MKPILLFLLISSQAFGQKECDSLDFYYSDSAATHFGKINQLGGYYRNGTRETIKVNLFKQQIYTEMVCAGGKPVSGWKDARFIGRGTIKDVQFQQFDFPYIIAGDYYSFNANPYPMLYEKMDTAYWNHITKHERFKFIKADTTVTGIVTKIFTERDGDLHVILKQKNKILRCEIICYQRVNEACNGFWNHTKRPKIGSKVMVTGDYIYDRWHNWHEMHPVKKIETILN